MICIICLQLISGTLWTLTISLPVNCEICIFFSTINIDVFIISENILGKWRRGSILRLTASTLQMFPMLSGHLSYNLQLILSII